MGESTLKIDRCCPLVTQGFSIFLGLFQVIMANPEIHIHSWVLFFHCRVGGFLVFFLYIFQVMVNRCFWARWFGFRWDPRKWKGLGFRGVPRFESQTTGPQTNNSPFVDFLVQSRGEKNNCEAWVLDPNRLEEARPWWCFTVGNTYVIYIIT